MHSVSFIVRAWIYASTVQLISALPHREDPQQIIVDPETNPTCNFTSYTALGDSYACGFGAQQRLRLCKPNEPDTTANCTTLECGKDTGSYAYLFAKHHSIPQFQYLACDGNGTKEVLHDQIQNTAAFGQPDLVTLNVGGDDQSFFRRVGETCLNYFNYDEEKCNSEIKRARNIISNQESSFTAIFDAIKHATRGRQVTVVVMSYARFLAPIRPQICAHGSSFIRATDGQYDEMNALALELNGMLNKTTVEAGYIFVDVDLLFDGHRFCDGEAYDPERNYFNLLPVSGNDTAGVPYEEAAALHPTVTAVKETYLKELNRVLGC